MSFKQMLKNLTLSKDEENGVAEGPEIIIM